MGEAQSRSVMLQHQDPALDSTFSIQGGGTNNDDYSSSSLRNRKCDKDGNFNFLSSKDDENRNQVRPRNLGPLGRDPPHSTPSPDHGTVLSPRSRLPCWTTLEPLPEIESGDDGYGRVPPDGAEEGRVTGEEARMMMMHCEEKQREKLEAVQQRSKSSLGLRGRDDEEDKLKMENDDEWADTESDSEYSDRSGSMSSLNLENRGCDRIGVGEPKPSNRDGRRSLAQSGSLVDEDDERSSDSDGEAPELLDAVWTLRDRERFKAQEMEKHQVQLTMYRRLALIRWVRTLQSRVQEQQNRLQTSFDVILTHRKELLRMGAAANAAPPAAAVGQS